MMKNLFLALASSAALMSGAAQAATADYLIRIDGISGTSQVDGFEDYIVLESWSLGFTRGVCQNLYFAKQMDAASAPLTGATILGTVYPTIILVARRTGGDARPFTYMKLTLTGSVFTSFQTGGSNGSSILPTEQISLQPSSVKFEAFQQDPISGGITLVATNSVTCQKPK